MSEDTPSVSTKPLAQELQRVRTEYSIPEDRLRLVGEDRDGNRIAIWLTFRLLQRLVPVLLKYLDEQLGEQAEKAGPTLKLGDLQEFAQASAKSALRRGDSEPVHWSEGDSQWLANSVDYSSSKQGVRLVFVSAAEHRAGFVMPAPLLRQWLTIVYSGYRQAGWSTAVWPEWMEAVGEKPAEGADKSPVVLH